MPNLGDELQKITDLGIRPRRDPIGIINDDELHADILSFGLAISENPGKMKLNTNKTVMREYSLVGNEDTSLMPLLSKLKIFKDLIHHLDCDDRAIWLAAHARRRFPGIPIGIVWGKSDDPRLADPRHAVNVIWHSDGKKRLFWEPLMNLDGSHEDESFPFQNWLTTFPEGNIRAEVNFPMANILDKKALLLDQVRMVYPLEGDGGLLDYVLRQSYNESCDDLNRHEPWDDEAYINRWMDYDEVLWAYAHAHRAYPGCMVGMVFGDINYRKPPSGLLISGWQNDQESIRFVHKFLATEMDNRGNFTFKPPVDAAAIKNMNKKMLIM